MNAKLVKEYIVKWLKSYSVDHNMKGFVTGISGGIDSAVTSALCAETGLENIVLSMPIFQGKSQLKNACDHIRWLKSRYPAARDNTVNLERTFNSIRKDLPDTIQDGLTLANTRSRLRMTVLYACASHYNMLVAGTGNKVEDFGVGFFTKYGDGGVDISPIADLLKSEICELAGFMGIEESIIEAKPTDGLWEDDRSDEEQIGASYEELEWAMTFFETEEGDEGLSPRQKEVMEIYRKLNKKSRHKMEPVPVCLIPDEIKSA